MPLSRRYSPEHPSGESCVFGMDFAAIIPAGIELSSATLTIFTNTVPPVAADADWTKGAVQVHDSVCYATLSGGKVGTDYQLVWSATDSDGFIWPRTALCLCSPTS